MVPLLFGTSFRVAMNLIIVKWCEIQDNVDLTR